MAGFVALFEPNTSSQDREKDFQCLLEATAKFKNLEIPKNKIQGCSCTASKLDGPSSLHRNFVQDDQSNSWLIVAGTVIALEGDNEPTFLLETLLKNYLEKGTKALDKIDGHYAIVIYDGRDDSISVVSDPMGHFSVFYGKQGDRTFISTSALAVAQLIKSPPDIVSLESFLRLGIVHKDRTFWQEVKRLLPAKVRKFTGQGEVETEYWSISYDKSLSNISIEEALVCAKEMLARNFNLLVKREGQVWADLTGGFDTRVATMLVEKVGVPFRAYCVGPTDHPDVMLSRFISQEMGWDYRHMPMPDDWEREQLNWLSCAVAKGDARLAVSSLSPVLWGHTQRANTYKVNVTGLGGDEWREVTYKRMYLFNWGKTYAYDRLIGAGSPHLIPLSVMNTDRTEEVVIDWRSYLSEIVANYDYLPNLLKGQLLFVRFRYPTHGGAFLSAGSGIMRSLMPFCLKEPVNFALSLNYKWRLNYHHKFIRSFLEQENAKLANIETAVGGPAIPMRINNIRKFWPLWKSILGDNIRWFTRKLRIPSRKIGPNVGYTSYPIPSWNRKLVEYSRGEGLLESSSMVSGGLYKPEMLQAFIAGVMNNSSSTSEFLDRVITIEIALRATGSSVN